jgi:hypothetical protein
MPPGCRESTIVRRARRRLAWESAVEVTHLNAAISHAASEVFAARQQVGVDGRDMVKPPSGAALMLNSYVHLFVGVGLPRQAFQNPARCSRWPAGLATQACASRHTAPRADGAAHSPIDPVISMSSPKYWN